MAGDSQPLLPTSQRAYDNPVVEINNKATSFAKKAAITLGAVAIIGAVTAVTVHSSLSGFGGNTALFSGGASIISGIAYSGLRFIRDRRQAEAAKKGFKDAVTLGELEEEVKSLKSGDILLRKKEVLINGKRYMLEVLKGQNGIEKITLRNK